MMSELSAEVRVVVHAHDRPAAHMDHEDVAVLPTGRDELVLFFTPPDARRWLSEITEAINSATEGEREPLTEPADIAS